MSLEVKLSNLVIELYKIGAVKFGNFKMKVGLSSPVYLDLRILVSHPKVLETLSLLLWEFAESKVQGDHLCGVPYNALPIATIISSRHNIPMLIRRKEPKNYGTKKLVEGQFKQGDTCIIIEDVVTSGSSIMETVGDLENEGLKITAVVVIVDRGQGAQKNLSAQGIPFYSMLTLTKMMNILCNAGLIDGKVVNDMNDYLEKSQISIPCVHHNQDDRLKLTFGKRSTLAANPVGKALLNLMEEKKTTLCVAVDVVSAEKLLHIATEIGPYICVLKTHADAVSDFTKETAKILQDIAKKEKFIIMEDRKFSDIGKTVSLQYGEGPTKIIEWADLVTCHSIAGKGTISGLMAVAKEKPRGCFLVAEMSSEGNLITSTYTKGTQEMAVAYPEFVAGLVTQSVLKGPLAGLIQLTPGVRICSGTSTNGATSTDGLGQQWISPEEAVIERGADIVVVGRGITEAADVREAAKLYQNKLWSAYQTRIA